MFNWTSFLTYALVTAFTPGPNNLMSMSNASRLGLRAALPFNGGILLGQCAVMGLCALLGSALGALIPKIKLPMQLLGAVYLLSLAYQTFRAPPQVEGKNTAGGFLAGVAVQFVNPKLFLYGMMSMEAYILPAYAGDTGAVLGFALLLSAIGCTSTVCWAVFGSAFRALFSRYARVTNTVMALLLVYCAVALFL